MSDAEIEKITDSAGTGAPNFTYGLNSGGSDSGLAGFAYTASGTEPSSPANGDVWFDTANDKYYTYINGEFKQLTHENAAPTQNAWSGQRGVIGGGYTQNNGTSLNVINYIDISTTGNAVDFGDLSNARDGVAALSNQTRGVFGGGKTNGSRQNVMDYVTISTTGNATDFGDLLDTRAGMGASSNGTRGIFAGGYGSGSGINAYKTDIDYITVATTGNATDFGDLVGGNQLLSSFADLTRGVIAGGYSLAAAGDNTLQYITFDTTGNTTDFGDLTQGGYLSGSFSDATRGVFGGGSGATYSFGDVIDYVTIQTTGNATDFGDLSVGRETSGMADATRGVFSSGGASPYVNTMDYVTIQTTGNATDFGDNTDTIGRSGTCSGAAS